MSYLWLIAIGNLIVWGSIIGMMFLMASREKHLLDELIDLEGRLGDEE